MNAHVPNPQHEPAGDNVAGRVAFDGNARGDRSRSHGKFAQYIFSVVVVRIRPERNAISNLLGRVGENVEIAQVRADPQAEPIFRRQPSGLYCRDARRIVRRIVDGAIHDGEVGGADRREIREAVMKARKQG